MKKIINIALWLIALSLIVVGLSFANKNQQKVKLTTPIIKIDYASENRFIDENDVLKEVIQTENDTTRLLNLLDVAQIEERLKNNFAIKNAQVYKTVDGKLEVSVVQNRPIVRVINNKNESYYIDEDGFLMPTSTKFTARLLVVNGNIFSRYTSYNKQKLDLMSDSLKATTLLDELYQLATFIDGSEFWKAQIEQIYVNKELEIELIPKVGNHIIVFGKPNNINAKFKKLIVFYEKGLSKTGWNEYSKINLSYKNQIVCTKIYN
ncbi:MAG: hypothetical protein CVT95_10910 [Bacteroidetes bacterium HGW-Bacteroidetes-12]|nr:MAG: hypothetical protein CVT95_10910 [Bacteroidetes bacterium HGW-Bacteroidetes-12]